MIDLISSIFDYFEHSKFWNIVGSIICIFMLALFCLVMFICFMSDFPGWSLYPWLQ